VGAGVGSDVLPVIAVTTLVAYEMRAGTFFGKSRLTSDLWTDFVVLMGHFLFRGSTVTGLGVARRCGLPEGVVLLETALVSPENGVAHRASVVVRLETDRGHLASVVVLLENDRDHLAPVVVLLETDRGHLASVVVLLETDRGHLASVVVLLENDCGHLASVVVCLESDLARLASVVVRLDTVVFQTVNVVFQMKKGVFVIATVGRLGHRTYPGRATRRRLREHAGDRRIPRPDDELLSAGRPDDWGTLEWREAKR